MLKKLITLAALSLVGVSAYAQRYTVSENHINDVSDNRSIDVYYPSFSGGEYAASLDSATLSMLTRFNLREESSPISNLSQLDKMYQSNGDTLAQVGLRKSIEPIDYVHLATWSYFENNYVSSLLVQQYVDMGTAIPMIVAQDFNIGAQGRIFEPTSLITDTTVFMEKAVKHFLKDRKLPENALRLQTGLKYELDELPLANVSVFTQEGLLMFYNRGEIAPMSTPAIIILVPYKDFKDLLPEDFFENQVEKIGGEKEFREIVRYIERQNSKYSNRLQNRRAYGLP